MDEDDCRVEGELHEMEVDRLEQRIRELEAENSELRKALGLPARRATEKDTSSRDGKISLDLVNGVLTIKS